MSEVPTTKTRVCFKNLPIQFDETKLENWLLQEHAKDDRHGTALVITDSKILRRRNDGVSRKIGFVGFRDAASASYTIHRFHQTYCLTSKLTVEPAHTKMNSEYTTTATNTNTKEMPRPWSKHSKGSSRYERIHGSEKHEQQQQQQGKEKTKKTKEEQKVKEAEDPNNRKKKEDFLAAMGISSSNQKPKFWANDDDHPVGAVSTADTIRSTPSPSRQEEEDEEEELSVAVSEDSGGVGADVMASSKPQVSMGTAMSDLEFLKTKQSKTKDTLDSEDEEEEEDDEKEENKADDHSDSDHDDSDSDSSDSDSDSSEEGSDGSENEQEKSKDTVKTTTASTPEPTDGSTQDMAVVEEEEDVDVDDDHRIAKNRLFVRNLPFSTTEEDLREAFGLYGTIMECHLPIDDQKRQKGYAFVAFQTDDDAARCRHDWHGRDFQGRILDVLPARKAKQQQTLGDANVDLSKLSYKERQELERRRRQDATQGTMLSSHVRSDAVVDTLAERLGLRKGELLNVKDGLSSGEAAVRLALGETQIIQENRNYFRQHGIDMEALVSLKTTNPNRSGQQQQRQQQQQPEEIKRSKTSILVKNLPFAETQREDLEKMFPDAIEILLPPSRTIALVKYDHPVDAKRAFQKQNYKRFKHVPLYLEWPPLDSNVGKETTDGDNGNRRDNSGKGPLQDVIDSKEEEEEVENVGVSQSIYVRNLNFSTTEDKLYDLFSDHTTVRAVKIPTKAAPIKRGKATAMEQFLSMGYGFVECDSEESVAKAIKALQGTNLDGHRLELQRSSKSVSIDSAKGRSKPPRGKNPTKLMVRNVPFQATRKELLQLFGSFGSLKKVRLPKKFDGGHRGFAFVEYLTSGEAQNAMTALSSTHLYGRHLVLEWADNEPSQAAALTNLRQMAKRDVAKATAASSASAAAQPRNKKIRFG